MHKLTTLFPQQAIWRVLLGLMLAASAVFSAAPAAAQVQVSFHSFNGSVLFGRYPHTFVLFEGHLQDTGDAVKENFGFSAKVANMAVLRGPVEHIVMSEDDKSVARTTRHFTIPISDATYRQMRAEIEAWRTMPGRYYDLDTRNCIHFVGRMAQMAGLQVTFPQNMLRKPRTWLNHITQLNPRLGAAPGS